MATYKKRGYKPKTKKEKVEAIEENSTTAEVFNTLDESASKTEEWVVKNQNIIFGVIGFIKSLREVPTFLLMRLAFGAGLCRFGMFRAERATASRASRDATSEQNRDNLVRS